MKPEILIPIGIFLVAGLIFVGAVAVVFKGVLARGIEAHKDIRKALPWLFEQGFRFQSGPASWFAPVVKGTLSNGVTAKLHFQIPGRGYTGGLHYDGVSVYVLQLVGRLRSRRVEFARILEAYPGKLIYESDSRIQWQPQHSATQSGPLPLRRLIEDLNEVL